MWYPSSPPSTVPTKNFAPANYIYAKTFHCGRQTKLFAHFAPSENIPCMYGRSVYVCGAKSGGMGTNRIGT